MISTFYMPHRVFDNLEPDERVQVTLAIRAVNDNGGKVTIYNTVKDLVYVLEGDYPVVNPAKAVFIRVMRDGSKRYLKEPKG